LRTVQEGTASPSTFSEFARAVTRSCTTKVGTLSWRQILSRRCFRSERRLANEIPHESIPRRTSRVSTCVPHHSSPPVAFLARFHLLRSPPCRYSLPRSFFGLKNVERKREPKALLVQIGSSLKPRFSSLLSTFLRCCEVESVVASHVSPTGDVHRALG